MAQGSAAVLATSLFRAFLTGRSGRVGNLSIISASSTPDSVKGGLASLSASSLRRGSPLGTADALFHTRMPRMRAQGLLTHLF